MHAVSSFAPIRRVPAWSRFLLPALLLIGLSMPLHATEEPEYKVVRTLPDFEVRQYAAYTVAEVVVFMAAYFSESTGHKILRGFGFGEERHVLEPKLQGLPMDARHHAQGHERHGEEELDQGCVGQGLAPRDQARRKIYLTADLFENSQSQTITRRGDGKSVAALNAVKGRHIKKLVSFVMFDL